jgi:hypothetical protein
MRVRVTERMMSAPAVPTRHPAGSLQLKKDILRYYNFPIVNRKIKTTPSPSRYQPKGLKVFRWTYRRSQTTESHAVAVATIKAATAGPLISSAACPASIASFSCRPPAANMVGMPTRNEAHRLRTRQPEEERRYHGRAGAGGAGEDRGEHLACGYSDRHPPGDGVAESPASYPSFRPEDDERARDGGYGYGKHVLGQLEARLFSS